MISVTKSDSVIGYAEKTTKLKHFSIVILYNVLRFNVVRQAMTIECQTTILINKELDDKNYEYGNPKAWILQERISPSNTSPVAWIEFLKLFNYKQFHNIESSLLYFLFYFFFYFLFLHLAFQILIHSMKSKIPICIAHIIFTRIIFDEAYSIATRSDIRRWEYIQNKSLSYISDSHVVKIKKSYGLH